MSARRSYCAAMTGDVDFENGGQPRRRAAPEKAVYLLGNVGVVRTGTS